MEGKRDQDPATDKTGSGVCPPLDTATAKKTRATAEARSQKQPSYKPLPKEFRRDGFQYRQIAREGNAAIYEQQWTGCAEPSPVTK